MEQITTLLMMAIVILPIVFGGRFHGLDSYKQYYDSRVNGGRSNSMTASHEKPKESFYEVKEEKSRFEDNTIHENKVNFGFSNEWQPRSGGNNYVVAPRCDHLKQTFCEDVPDYPQAFVNQMLAKNSSLLHYANKDVIAIAPRLDNEEEPLCLSTERLIVPRSAVNMQDQWMYIVQADENFRQSLRIEACQEEDAKCRMIDGFAEGYITSCKQKYIYRELSAISSDGELVRDFFRLPASCCCHVQFQAEEARARVRSFVEGRPSSDYK